MLGHGGLRSWLESSLDDLVYDNPAPILELPAETNAGCGGQWAFAVFLAETRHEDDDLVEANRAEIEVTDLPPSHLFLGEVRFCRTTRICQQLLGTAWTVEMPG